MSDNKKYYYMRLKENFFDTDEMKVLESMQDGYMYSNILLKLYLKSLRNDGKLMFNERIPYNSQMLATITGHQVGTIEKAMKIFKDMGLIEILETGEIYMLDIQNFIGRTSTEADRRRDYYNRIEAKKNQSEISHEDSHEISTPKIDIDKELDTDIEKDIKKDKKIKKIKKKYGTYKHVLLTDEEHDKLNAEYANADEIIEYLDSYIEEKGYKANSHYLSIKRWVVDAVNRKHNQKPSGYHVKPLPEYMNKVSNNPFLDMLEEEKQQ